VVLEYGLSDPYLDDVGREFVLTFTAMATKVGEPLRLTWSPEEAEQMVRGAGFSVVDHPRRADLVNRYFADRTDGLLPWSVAGLLAAMLP
jgi:hypothetical protein